MTAPGTHDLLKRKICKRFQSNGMADSDHLNLFRASSRSHSQEAVVKFINTKRVRALLLVILVGLVGSGLLVYAQGTSGSLTGLITDPSGAAIPGATVTLTNIDTN